MFRRTDHHAKTPARETALACLEAGVRAANPGTAVENRLALEGDELRIDGREYDLAAYDRIVLCGGGKAAAGAAQALESLLGDRLEEGVVVSPEPPESAAGRLEYLPGDHPTPSERNVVATEKVLEAADRADVDTLFLAEITGGASALWCAPAEGLSLADLAATTEALLTSGASIDEINAVRKHCSAIKGGRLARAAAPATVVTLAISDVVGDERAVIGSGPTVPDDSTFADALAVCERYGLEGELPEAVIARLEAGTAGEIPETPGASDPPFDSTPPEWHLLATNRTAVNAAREVAAERGYRTLVLSSRLRGEARDVGRVHAAVAEEIVAAGDPVEPPAVVLSGGEVTVTVRDGENGGGSGGPNQELALAAALEFHQRDTDAMLASVDTDGIDGPTDACGAVVDRETVDDVATARRGLDGHDSYGVLETWGALLETGYTGTNVNDLRVLVVEE